MSLQNLRAFDHSVPLRSGYAFRTLTILGEQRRLGLEALQLMTTMHYRATYDKEQVDGYLFHRKRVPTGGWPAMPLLEQWAVIHDSGRRPDALVLGVQQTLLQREHWTSIRSAARAFVERERSWTGSVAHYADVYDLAQRRLPRA